MRTIKILFLSLLFSSFAFSSFSQQTVKELPYNKEFEKATRLFENNKYAAAQDLYLSAIQTTNDANVRTESEYCAAICAIRLFNPDGEAMLLEFIKKYPLSPKKYSGYFELANVNFRNEKYEQAIEWYLKVSTKFFSNPEMAEYLYKLGYSYYKTKLISEAKPLFREVKDSRSVYAENSKFYYSYIEYIDKNYKTALAGFEALADSSIFAKVVPPYICQIYYVFEEYDKLIQYASKIESIVNPKQLLDVHRVLAGAYYKTLQFDKALPYYEKYFAEAKAPSKSDYYELGYLYYRSGKYEKATEFFKFVTSENDTIAQNAYYHLGDCYIKTGHKEKARNAFRAAIDYDVFPTLKEEATFIHAKLIYELSYAPFNEAISYMQSFIENYPQSKHLDEANSLLVKIFMSSKNYKDALLSLEKISVYTTDLKIAYQQIAYYRALELVNNRDYEQAIKMFDKSLQYGIFDKVIRSYCFYWKAEAFYKLEKYENARNLYNDFVLSSGAFNTDEYIRAHYNIAYTYFEEERYSEAIVWFRKYLNISQDATSSFHADASIRTGDCYYILKDFNQAIKYYSKAVESGTFDTEYALFQQAYCNGLIGNNNNKVALLSNFLENYPASGYYDDALFEQAEAYVELSEFDNAVKNYNIIIQNYRAGTYIKKALLQVALIVYNAKDIDQALEMYKQVIEQYPGSDEAETAVSMVENIYRKKSDMDSFFSYIQNQGGHSNYPEVKQDSLTFEVAQEKYLDGDCNNAQPLLTNYIQKFGNGFFVLQAHFYKAECFFENGYEYEALPDYEFVINEKPNQYVEHALTRAAYINIQQQQYEKALNYLIPLEQEAQVKSNLLYARYGLLKSYVELKDYKKIIEIGETYIITEKLEDDQKRWAQMQIAYAYDSLKDTTKALIKYLTIGIDYETAEGSEARYRASKILFDQGKYNECEKEIKDFLEKNTPHQYWLGKEYILWAKVFIARNEIFQARYTLQNIVENYDNKEDGIIENAFELLDHITDIETAAARKVEDPVVVPMGKNLELFETPEENKATEEVKETKEATEAIEIEETKQPEQTEENE